MTKEQKNKVIDNFVAKIKQEIAHRLPTNCREYAIVMQAIDEVRKEETK